MKFFLVLGFTKVHLPPFKRFVAQVLPKSDLFPANMIEPLNQGTTAQFHLHSPLSSFQRMYSRNESESTLANVIWTCPDVWDGGPNGLCKDNASTQFLETTSSLLEMTPPTPAAAPAKSSPTWTYQHQSYLGKDTSVRIRFLQETYAG